jgi:hypothetical protein
LTRGLLRPRRRTDAERGRLGRAMRAEELDGLSFAFAARGVAAAAVAAWLVAIVPAPRLFYYLSVVGVLFVLGLIPHLFRRHRMRWRSSSPSWCSTSRSSSPSSFCRRR